MSHSPEQHIQQYLFELEEAADKVINDKHEIIALDRRRNLNREALRNLETSKESKTWTCMGKLFIRMPKNLVVKSVQEEQEHLNTEISNLRNALRPKVDHLNSLERKSPSLGGSLKPLSAAEHKAIGQLLPNV